MKPKVRRDRTIEARNSRDLVRNAEQLGLSLKLENHGHESIFRNLSGGNGQWRKNPYNSSDGNSCRKTGPRTPGKSDHDAQ
jgi:hypothetical protein